MRFLPVCWLRTRMVEDLGSPHTIIDKRIWREKNMEKLGPKLLESDLRPLGYVTNQLKCWVIVIVFSYI